MARAAISTAAFLQSVEEIAAAAFQRRRQSKENAAAQRNQHGKKQSARVEMDFAGARKALREELQSRARSPGCEKQSQGSRAKRQQDAFRQELAHEPCLPRAQRRANRKFAAARRRSSEH